MVAYLILFFGALVVALMDDSWYGLIVFCLMLAILIDTSREAYNLDNRLEELLKKDTNPPKAG